MTIDSHLTNMVNAAENNEHKVDIYFEHTMIEQHEFITLPTIFFSR
jgi:hypothetical protein